MSGRTYVGFGLGPIQSGLFLHEAHRTGLFGRLVVAEVEPRLVTAVREAGGILRINIAHADRIETATIAGIEILNPNDSQDRQALQDAIAVADELCTALPSVAFYDRGGEASPVACLAGGFARRAAAHRGIIYTAENDTRAAECLAESLGPRRPGQVQVLNTVIGKMSGVVTDWESIRHFALAPLTPDAGRAVLVEAFNRIQISRVHLAGFTRGLSMFEEKDDLAPFEEAKLYGHNAVHALLGYLAHDAGLETMDLARGDDGLMSAAREAFDGECGAGLRRRHAGSDPLFTETGWKAYAGDLLVRMTNPFLHDAVARVIRDPHRKLGWNDRLIGAMRLALGAGVRPVRLAAGVRAALRFGGIRDLRTLWPDEARESPEAGEIVAMTA